MPKSRILYSLTGPDTASCEGVQSFLQKRPPKFTGTIENQRPFGYPWWSVLDVRPKI